MKEEKQEKIEEEDRIDPLLMVTIRQLYRILGSKKMRKAIDRLDRE